MPPPSPLCRPAYAGGCCAGSGAGACYRAMTRGRWRNGNTAAASPSMARCASRLPTPPGASGCRAIAPGPAARASTNWLFQRSQIVTAEQRIEQLPLRDGLAPNARSVRPSPGSASRQAAATRVLACPTHDATLATGRVALAGAGPSWGVPQRSAPLPWRVVGLKSLKTSAAIALPDRAVRRNRVISTDAHKPGPS